MREKIENGRKRKEKLALPREILKTLSGEKEKENRESVECL